MKRKTTPLVLALVIGCLAMVGSVQPVCAQAEEEVAALTEAVNKLYGGSIADDIPSVDFLWTIVAAALVFLMHAGFACVESGFTRAKNTVNIIMKNYLTVAVGLIVFYFIGYGLMFGKSNGFFGFDGFMLSHWGGTEEQADMWSFVFFIFQAVFCATGATIVSGAVAERIKFGTYILFVVFMCAIIYPVFGHWAWSSLWQEEGATQGWLVKLGFLDFAGSSVVHAIGGFSALAGAFLLGPRTGKYTKDGGVRVIPGHSIPLAALGCFLLWFGWIGFNAGSTTAATDSQFAQIAVTTMLAAAAGTVGAMVTSWIHSKKPDVGMTLNGSLAGLVGITAPCDIVGPNDALAIGFIAGIIVVLSCNFIERVLRVDDPVGAISVHGVCGAWGILSCGIFINPLYADGAEGIVHGFQFGQFGVQVIGIGACLVWALVTAGAFFAVARSMKALRVSQEEETEGLDFGEHGANAYPDFAPSIFR